MLIDSFALLNCYCGIRVGLFCEIFRCWEVFGLKIKIVIVNCLVEGFACV